MCRARSEHAAAACKAWCSAGKAAGQGSFESVASINEPSQHEDGQHVAHASDAVGWDRSCGVMCRAGGMSGCTERVVSMLQPPAKPGAVQAKLQAKGASNLLHPSTSLLSTRWAARRSCIGCCWVGPVMWCHVSSWGYVRVYRARRGRAAAACQAWCSASKASGQGSFASAASAHEPS